MKPARCSAVVAFLLLATAGNAWGDTYHFYHTMEKTFRFSVRLRSLETQKYYYSNNPLAFKGRPWTVKLPDGNYEISRRVGRQAWKKIDVYRIEPLNDGNPEGRKNAIYIGTNQAFWWIDNDGDWHTAQGAPPVRMEIAHGLRRIPYFGINGKASENPPGVLVTFVGRGSAATKLKRNGVTYFLEPNVDVITEVNGKPVRTFAELKKMIEASQGFMEFKAYDLQRKATLNYTANF